MPVPVLPRGRRHGGVLMAWRSGHGSGAGMPRIEVCPADELPTGTRAQAPRAPTRGPDGRFLPGTGTSALASQGGKASKESRALRRLLGLAELPAGHAYEPYSRMSREWRDDHIADLAANVGGGVVGPGVASIVSTAALQLGASRFLQDRGAHEGDAKLLLEASRLADASRQNLLAAHELAAKEGQARGRSSGPDTPWLVAGSGAEGSK